MDIRNLKDGGQLLVTSSLSDHEFENYILEVIKSYDDIKNVFQVENGIYNIDLSSWRHKKVIVLYIENNNAKRLLRFGYDYCRTKQYSVLAAAIDILIFVIWGNFIGGFISTFLLVLFLVFFQYLCYYIFGFRYLNNRCKQYIRDIDNALKMGAPMQQHINTPIANSSNHNTNVCSNCGNHNLFESKYCSHCGKELEQTRYCVNCGNKIKGNISFCPKCGNKL